MKHLVAMAGLPATGKSTLAARLAAALDAVVLDKDVVRAALFPPSVRTYSVDQDDLCMAAIYRAVENLHQEFPLVTVIVDGRTFVRSYQVADLATVGGRINHYPVLIECVCSDEVARRRLEQQPTKSTHPAANRSFDLYLRLKASAQPIWTPHLTLDTGRLSPEECLARSLTYLRDKS